MNKRYGFKPALISSFLCLLPVIPGLILYNRLPELIATHWNFAGEPDGWSSKPFAVFGLPLIMFACSLAAHFFVRNDPKRANHSGAFMIFIYCLVPALSILMSSLTLMSAMGTQINVGGAVGVFVGLILAVCGIFLPKCRQNYTMGIKLPWTLASEENWDRTHKMAGPLWVIGGVAFALLSFTSVSWGGLAIIMLIVLVPGIYSFALYKRGI